MSHKMTGSNSCAKKLSSLFGAFDIQSLQHLHQIVANLLVYDGVFFVSGVRKDKVSNQTSTRRQQALCSRNQEVQVLTRFGLLFLAPFVHVHVFFAELNESNWQTSGLVSLQDLPNIELFVEVAFIILYATFGACFGAQFIFSVICFIGLQEFSVL